MPEHTRPRRCNLCGVALLIPSDSHVNVRRSWAPGEAEYICVKCWMFFLTSAAVEAVRQLEEIG